MHFKRPALVISALLIILSLSILTALISGPAKLPIDKIVGALFSDKDSTARTILLAVRMPRIVLAGMVGAALSVTGVVFQALFRNPLADPYLVGVSSGAAVGATAAISLGLSGVGLFSAVPFMAFCGSLGATYIAYRLAKVGSLMSISSLLLAGIAIKAFFDAIIAVLMVYGTHDLHAMVFWLMGGFSARGWNDVIITLPWILTIPVLVFFARDLNVLLLGEEKAKNLGVDVEWTKKILLALAALIAAAAVSVSGIIGFVGLVVPHIIRILIGPDHRLLVPASILVGASFLILADTAARTLFGSIELPVGVVTAFFGAPFFIYLLKTRRQVYF